MYYYIILSLWLGTGLFYYLFKKEFKYNDLQKDIFIYTLSGLFANWVYCVRTYYKDYRFTNLLARQKTINFCLGFGVTYISITHDNVRYSKHLTLFLGLISINLSKILKSV